MDWDGEPRTLRLFFGTTSGEVSFGERGGARFRAVASDLPRILSVRCAWLR